MDPNTGVEKLSFRYTVGDEANPPRPINVSSLSAEAMAEKIQPLEASLPPSTSTSVFHTGATDSPKVVVAFNRPVVDFAETSPSLRVTGATVASVSADVADGESSNAYLVTLSPTGEGAITFGLVANQACAGGGICAADGTTLSAVPSSLGIVPPPTVTLGRAMYSVAEGASVNVRVRLSAAHRSVREITIPVMLDTSGSASDADFTAEESVSIEAGETGDFLTIHADADDLVEGSETATLKLGTLPDKVSVGATTEATVTVADQDRAEISFTVPRIRVAEGGHAPLNFAITNGVTFVRDQTITLTLGGTATPADDFILTDGDNQPLSAPYNLTFPADKSYVSGTLRVVNDTALETSTETVTVSARLDLTGASLGNRTVTIAASDPAEPPPTSGVVVVKGTARVGETLVADTSGVSIGEGMRFVPFGYNWVADDGTATTGDLGRDLAAHDAYWVRPADAGLAMKVGAAFWEGEQHGAYLWSAATSTVAATVPDRPRNLDASVGEVGSLTLNWEAPMWDYHNYSLRKGGVGDGGSPITGYKVQWKDSSANWDSTNEVTEETVTTGPHTITGLRADRIYNVRVLATNAVGDGAPSREVSVNDGGVNLAPVITEDSWKRYPENAAGTVHTFHATDPENDPVSWRLAGPDSNNLAITGGALSFVRAPDFEDQDHGRVYRVTVQALDGTNTAEHDVTVVVTDLDEPPVITGDSTIDDYDENGTGSVATYTSRDPEGDSNITWSLGGPDRADFDITGGVLSFKEVPDYERPADSGRNSHYKVTVHATDSNNNRGELQVDVIVQDVDERHEIAGPDTADDFPENSATSRQVGRYTASDPEGEMVKLSLSTGGAPFTLSSNGVLTFNESPDYEERSSYSVTVRAVAGSHTVDKAVTVNIQNMEEQGTVTLSAVQPLEGTPLTARLEDDDGPTGTTWQWYRTSSRGSTGSAIDGATSDTYTPGPEDVGRYLRATAFYDDGHGTGKTTTIVSANRVQEAPLQPEPPLFPADGDYNHSVRENTQAGASLGMAVRATDADNDRLTYTIPASDDFEIAAATGQLRTRRMLDHEGQAQHFVTVTATDPGDLTDTVLVTITVEDVDETPVVAGPVSPEVAENGATGVATYTATDPDVEGIEWVLTGTDSGAFTLTGGALAFREIPDHEERNRYRVTIEAREQGDGTSVGRLSVTVNVTNVDEPGMVQVPVSEPRVGQRLTATVSDQDGGVGSIEWKWERRPSGGNWTPIPGATSRTYTPVRGDNGLDLRVTAIYRDGHGPGKTETYQFSSPVSLRPYFDTDKTTRSVQENTPEGWNVGSRFTARHLYNVNLTYSLAGADGIYFDIDETNGQLKTGGTPLDYEGLTDHEAELEITATAPDSETATLTVTVAVTDECRTAGEPPCAPGRPNVASASDTSLRVSWSTPSSPSGTTITGYALQYRVSGTNGSWIPESASGTGRSHVIEGLTKGTPYEVQVRAQNDIGGYGEWSQPGTGAPGYVPPPAPPPPPPPPPVVCAHDLGTVAATASRNGSWESGCNSEARSGSHARYYSFTLATESEATIELSSSAADPYLYLREESATSGTPLHENNDVADGNTDSRIVAILAAGSYTIEATTFSVGATGSFTLSVSAAEPPAVNCIQPGLLLCPPGDPLVAGYDANGDGAIDIGELFTAIDDYFAGVIGIGELFTIIDVYFSDPG